MKSVVIANARRRSLPNYCSICVSEGVVLRFAPIRSGRCKVRSGSYRTTTSSRRVTSGSQSGEHRRHPRNDTQCCTQVPDDCSEDASGSVPKEPALANDDEVEKASELVPVAQTNHEPTAENSTVNTGNDSQFGEVEFTTEANSDHGSESGEAVSSTVNESNVTKDTGTTSDAACSGSAVHMNSIADDRTVSEPRTGIIDETAAVDSNIPIDVGIMNATKRNKRREDDPYMNGSEQLDDYLEAQGLHRYHIPTDGNSLFRAVAEQVLDCQAKHTEVRSRCVAELRARPHLLRPVLWSGKADRCRRVEKRDLAISEGDENIVEPNLTEEVSRYCDAMSTDAVPGGDIEMCSMSLIFSVDFIVFNEAYQEPRNVTGNGFNEKVVLCVGGSQNQASHFDLVYTNARLEVLADTQSFVYNLLYTGVFGLGKEEVDFAVHEMVFNKERFHNQGTNRATFEQWCEAVSGGEVPGVHSLPSDESGRLVLAIKNGVPPFPFKVAKCLEKSVYRNVEYLTWCSEQREIHRKMSLQTPLLAVGVACVVCQAESSRAREGVVREIDLHAGFVKVFVNSLSEVVTVPLDRVKAVPTKSSQLPKQHKVHGLEMHKRPRKPSQSSIYPTRMSRNTFNCFDNIHKVEDSIIVPNKGQKLLPSPAGAHFWSSESTNFKSAKSSRSVTDIQRPSLVARPAFQRVQSAHKHHSMEPPVSGVAPPSPSGMRSVPSSHDQLMYTPDVVAHQFDHNIGTPEVPTLSSPGNVTTVHVPTYYMQPIYDGSYGTAIAIPFANFPTSHQNNGSSISYNASPSVVPAAQIKESLPSVTGVRSADAVPSSPPVCDMTPLAASGIPIPLFADNIYPQTSASAPVPYELIPTQNVSLPADIMSSPFCVLSSAAIGANPVHSALMAPPSLCHNTIDDSSLELACGLRFPRPSPEVDTQLAYRCERNGVLPIHHQETLNYFFNLGMAAYKNTMPTPMTTPMTPACPANEPVGAMRNSEVAAAQNGAQIVSSPPRRNCYVEFPPSNLSLPPPSIMTPVMACPLGNGMPFEQRPPHFQPIPPPPRHYARQSPRQW